MPIAEEVIPIAEEVVAIAEEIMPIAEEVVAIEVITKPKVEKAKAIKKENNKSSKKETKVEKIIEIPIEIPIVVKYPDSLPTLNDVEVLEFKKTDYYMDKLNNVFQMTPDEDLGMFIGVYNKNKNEILYMNDSENAK